MTYFGHLNELRKHLWFSVAMLLVGFAVSMVFFNDIIEVLTAPWPLRPTVPGENCI